MIENDDEPGICPTCNGSGEGQHDGSWCYACHGDGEIQPEMDFNDYWDGETT